MDNLSIFIIVVSIVLAVAFKWVLIRKIRHWMEQDLIRQLAGGDQTRLAQLQQQNTDMQAEGVKRHIRHERLHQSVRNGEPEQE